MTASETARPAQVPEETGQDRETVPGRLEQDAATAKTLLSGALLGELTRRVLEYENAITWNTSCLACPKVLDSLAEETFRRERAEGKLAALRSVLLEGGQGADMARRRALAIIGSKEGDGRG